MEKPEKIPPPGVEKPCPADIKPEHYIEDDTHHRKKRYDKNPCYLFPGIPLIRDDDQNCSDDDQDKKERKR